ncbi:NAD(P)-dependent oxidoreductase [Rhodococcus koreensis]|uniref:NAD(P)-dependent oxidoreductase n=1 Tax=Rhodococcus koreensis TaxID=99653 RepID=UPI00366ECAFD
MSTENAAIVNEPRQVPLPNRTVGLIGLGAMGAPIAQNFANAGQALVVRDADPTAQERFVEGNRTAVSASDLAEFAACDVVVLILPNSDIVDQVVLADGGLLTHLTPGSVIVDMGSSVPSRTRYLAQAAAARGIRVVDAPVSGGVTRALKADLAVMLGGDEATIASVMPLLETTGRKIVHVGPVGSGHAAKALNNLLSATGLVAAAEVLLVGRKFGIDPSTLLSVINASSGRNQATDTKYEQFIFSRTYASGFGAQLMRKDIGIALDLARQQDVPTVLGDVLGRMWGDAVDGLDAGADHTEVVRYLEQLSAVSLDALITDTNGSSN